MKYDTSDLGQLDSDKRIDLDAAIAYRVVRCARVLRMHLVRFLDGTGVSLTPEQYFIFARVGERPGASQSELADPLLGDYPNVTRLIDSLVKQELVERRPDPSDRRRHALYLTGAGRELADRLTPAVFEERRILSDGIDGEELGTFLRVLELLEGSAAQRAGIVGRKGGAS